MLYQSTVSKNMAAVHLTIISCVQKILYFEIIVEDRVVRTLKVVTF